jgi:hypothetical protein
MVADVLVVDNGGCYIVVCLHEFVGVHIQSLVQFRSLLDLVINVVVFCVVRYLVGLLD